MQKEEEITEVKLEIKKEVENVNESESSKIVEFDQIKNGTGLPEVIINSEQKAEEFELDKNNNIELEKSN